MNSSLDAFMVASTQRVISLEARFQGHHGINRHLIFHWLSQFDAAHRPLALELLEHVRYFNYGNLRELLGRALDEAPAQFPGVRAESIRYVVAGDIWEGDATIARLIHNNHLVPNERLLQYTDLRDIKTGDIGGLVFIKDFSGTGGQLVDWWTTTGEPLVLPLETPTLFVILILNHPARDTLVPLGIPFITSLELDPSHNVLSAASELFSDEQKHLILEYCGKTGATQEYLRGRGEAALLVAFDYGCPNNTLPILWWDSPGWSRLFQRRAY